MIKLSLATMVRDESGILRGKSGSRIECSCWRVEVIGYVSSPALEGPG